MKQKGNVLIVVLILAAALAAIGYLVYQNMQLKKQAGLPSAPPTSAAATASALAAPTATPKPTNALPAGWKMYQNTKYKFEIAHPSSYKELTSKEDLYGWEDAILLLYKGGQSYDLAVEIWNSEAEYKAKYTDASVYTAYKTKDGKFITLSNMNKDPEVAEIMATFKFTD